MASTKDVQDIMGMGSDARKAPAPKKKKKVVEAQPRLSGISREVQALMGDSVPPVQIVETPKYKSKPTLASKLFKVRHWEERPFQHAARTDGLVLKHWKRARAVARPTLSTGDGEVTGSDTPVPEPQFEEEFSMDRWNVKIRVPEYTDEQFEKNFKSDEWTREETDYLMQLASDYDLRWILIADRYDPLEIKPAQPNGNATGTEVAKIYPGRDIEALKSRYYQVAAKDLELRTPASNMTQSEFQLWEKMRNFDAKTEGLRKAMAEKLFERTKDEAEEEKTLLEELHRITKNEDDFKAMRRDLYARLEAAPSLRRNERGEEQNIVLSSAGLSDLLSRLFAKEKHLKRRVIPNGEAPSASGQTAADQSRRQSNQVHRRDTQETPAADSKKGSISAPIVRPLSKADEEKFGVSHPADRLTSGVSFRHEKINRVTTAKSQVQTQKINAALTELEIPARLSMPTEKVCREFERLISQIQLLLDARKTHTRVSEEVKVLEEARRQRLGELAPDAQEAKNGSAMDVDKKDVPASGQQPATTAENKHSAPTLQRAESTQATDDGPGPAVDEDEDEDEDDAEADDENDATNMTQTQIEDEQEDDEDNDESMARKVDVDDEEEEEEEEEEEDDDDDQNDGEEEEAEEDDDDEDEGTRALRRGADNDDDEEEENEEDEDQEAANNDEDEEDDQQATSQVNGAGSEDEEPEDEDEETQDVSMMDATQNVTGEDEEEQEDEPPSRPVSSGSAAAAAIAHKRSASVISEASKAGSNRSGASRKRKR
ncbi:swr complex subunit [Neophaeococcomyces mojaviensis]|uniref:Swr complex subunit n=1 Tax=Neophaeococcomyces mojaviensis TaxID=3383035 RepID=A0ACC3A961_9EURO|nr:swr complex subunit [Knufia sp. JES_112]